MDNQQQGYFPSQEQQAMLDPSPPGAHFPTITAKEEASFLELSPDALVIVDREGMIVLVNEPAATLFGYSLEELVDQPLEVLLPERFHAAHATHRAEYIMAPHRRPMGVGLDLRGKRKDGSEFPVDISLRPVFIGQRLHIMGAIRDMSTQHRLERERIQQAEHLSLQSTLLNLAHDAILVRDPISRIIF